MRTLTVQTPSHQYPIFIGNHLIEQADVLLKPYLSNKVAIVTNETIAPLYLESFQTTLTPPAARLPPLRGRVGERVQAAAFKQTLPKKRKLSPLPNPLPREREQITAPSTFSDGIGKESYP